MLTYCTEKKLDYSSLTAEVVRRKIIQMAELTGSGHISSGLSIVEILIAIFKEEKVIERGKFILSKGHGGIALYAIQNLLGFISDEEITTFQKNYSPLTTFPTDPFVRGLDFSSASLGHGLGVASGFALSNKLMGRSCPIYCLLSDGEIQEGSIYEAALFAGHKNLTDLRVLVDSNKIQAIDRVENVAPQNVGALFESLGWSVEIVDGHNVDQIADSLRRNTEGKPNCIICNTTKGKGVSFMENSIEWHYLGLNSEYLDLAKSEVGII